MYLTDAEFSRFIAKVDWRGKSHTDCWNWLGNKGRPRFWLRDSMVSGYTIAYLHWVGPMPAGSQINHHCDNPCCCNPDHLYAGTQKENCADRISRGRINSPKGTAHHLSYFVEADIITIRQRRASGETYVSIAKDYPCAKEYIGEICRREVWKHVP